SSSQFSSVSEPSSISSRRCGVVMFCQFQALSTTGAVSSGISFSVSFLLSRTSSHFFTSSGYSWASRKASGFSSSMSSNPSACLQGNLRLGQLHLNRCCCTSTMVVKGSAGVLYSPHTARSVPSARSHRQGAAHSTALPALTASGARDSIFSRLYIFSIYSDTKEGSQATSKLTELAIKQSS